MAKNFPIVLVVIGTRPEAIKMAPLIHAMSEASNFTVKVCVTAQHREMLDQVLAIFSIKPEYDLNLMQSGQSLTSLSESLLNGLEPVLMSSKPSLVLVHGDTTTTLMSSLACFYHRIPIGHVEAGLRTGNFNAPWPEEMNRSLVARLANFHFAPTEQAKNNLLSEGIDPSKIWVTGNTVIDSLLWILIKLKDDDFNNLDRVKKLRTTIDKSKKIILVTGHRRENFGDGINNLCDALLELSNESNVEIIYPVHPNPNVVNPVKKLLGNIKNIHIIDPLDYLEFVYLMRDCYLIITDSGGIQEEAPSLGKPVLVTRHLTERSEGLSVGAAMLVGTSKERIVEEAKRLLNNKSEYDRVASIKNPYGDGTAAKKIVDIIEGVLFDDK